MPSSTKLPNWKPGQSMPAYRPSPLSHETNAFGSTSKVNDDGPDTREPEVYSDDEDTDSSDEDEEGQELTPAMDAAILRTLRLIKSGDRRVYEAGDVLQAQLAETSLQAKRLNLVNNRARTSSSAQKPFSLQEHQRLALLASHQKFSSASNDADAAGAGRRESVDKYDPEALYDEDGQKVELPDTLIPLSHVEEERKLRAEVTQAFHLAGVANEGEDAEQEGEEEDGFLVKSDAKRTAAELEAQRKEYRDFLLAEGVGSSSGKQAEAELKRLLGLGEEADGSRRSMINIDGVDRPSGSGSGSKAGPGSTPGIRAGHSGQRDAAAMGQVESGESGEESGSKEVPGATVKKGKKGKKVEGVTNEKTVVKVAKRKKRAKEADDEFLMNYILNRGWIEDEPSEEQPTTRHRKPYVEPIDFLSGEGDRLGQGDAAPVDGGMQNEQAGGRNVADGGEKRDHPWGTLIEEDEFDDKAEEFETAYNFRFEEPGAAEIPSHPRSIPTAVRRPDDARKLARAAKAERKAAEKAAREEETRKQKGAKRREIEKVLQGLGVGEEELEGVLEELMEGDWDEAGWDRKMGELIERQMQEADEEDGEEKPVWNDEDGGQEGYGEDIEFDEGEEAVESMDIPQEQDDDDAPLDMDADFISFEPESKRAKKNKHKKKEKGKRKQEEEEAFVDIVERTEGNTVEGKKKKVKQAVEAYKKLDHEDMIGDLPTRFKYAKTAPTDYGLTPAEILLATDAELNAFLGMKHYAPYRGGGLGNAGQGKTRRLYELKAELAKRRWGEELEVDAEGFGKKTFGDGKSDQGWSNKRKRDAEGGTEAGQGGPTKKRTGKNERRRARKVDGDAAMPTQ